MRPRARGNLRIYRHIVPQGRDLKWFDLDMHEGAAILSFQEERTLTGREPDGRAYQHVIAALVDTGMPAETRRFRICGFGEDLSDIQEKDYLFVGSISSVSGYGWHLFEVLE